MNLTECSKWLRLILTALFLPLIAVAQIPGLDASSPAGLNLAIIRLFGEGTAFSAKAEVRVVDKAQKEVLASTMDFTLLDKNLRVKIDLTQLRHKDLPASITGSLKQVGLAEVVSLVRVDKKSSYIIYPSQQSYLATPLSKEEIDILQQPASIKRADIGQEAVDGRPATKASVTMTATGVKPVQATVWYAATPKNFPLQIQTVEDGSTSTIKFSQINLSRPNAKELEAPTGYKEYTSYQQLVTGMLSKMMGQAAEAN